MPNSGDVAEQPAAMLPWRGPSGRGLAIGYDMGAWGTLFGQGLRLKVPFGSSPGPRNWGVLLKGLMLHEEVYDAANDEKSIEFYLGGRLEFFGQSDVLLNVVRVYGGGGVQRFTNTPHLPRKGWGGGGQAGFEFFYWRAGSFFIEIGGHSGVARQRDSHALVLAGMHLYPWSI